MELPGSRSSTYDPCTATYLPDVDRLTGDVDPFPFAVPDRYFDAYLDAYDYPHTYAQAYTHISTGWTRSHGRSTRWYILPYRTSGPVLAPRDDGPLSRLYGTDQ